VGDFHRGCQHFHGRYYTGEKTDCNSAACKTSRAHKHAPAMACSCKTVVTELRRVQNLIHARHAECDPALAFTR
ncbi:hypothetical protein B0H21DRAFT_698934, partial [Amylocystis lapponica]